MNDPLSPSFEQKAKDDTRKAFDRRADNLHEDNKRLEYANINLELDQKHAHRIQQDIKNTEARRREELVAYHTTVRKYELIPDNVTDRNNYNVPLSQKDYEVIADRAAASVKEQNAGFLASIDKEIKTERDERLEAFLDRAEQQQDIRAAQGPEQTREIEHTRQITDETSPAQFRRTEQDITQSSSTTEREDGKRSLEEFREAAAKAKEAEKEQGLDQSMSQERGTE